MNAAQFLEIIDHADSLEKNELLQLKKVQENFPYFQIAHTLASRYEFLKNGGGQIPSLGYAAITSPNRIWLKYVVESPKAAEATTEAVSTPLEVVEKSTEEVVPSPEVAMNAESAKPPVEVPKPTRRKVPKEDLIETIKMKEKKKILDSKKKEQMDLIKAFSKASIKKATIKEIEAYQNTENLAAASTSLNDKLLSESYAKILAKQGKKQMAKEIYEKLILKFPDKRTYFADLIEKLKD